MCITASSEELKKYRTNHKRVGYKVFSVHKDKPLKKVRSPFLFKEYYKRKVWLKAVKLIKDKDYLHIGSNEPLQVGFHICNTLKGAKQLQFRINHQEGRDRRLVIYKVYYKDIVSAGHWGSRKHIKNVVASSMMILEAVNV